MKNLIIRHARQVVLVCKNGERILKGEALKNIAILEGSVNRGISVVADEFGKIECIGYDDDVEPQYNECSFASEVDATGMCVLPGLIDGHTHPVWVGDRVHEFAMKLAGASYMDVHKAGGGINFTVEHVHKATEDELYEPLKQRLNRMLQCGTTLVEAKSGYGLNTENEMKMLRVIERAKKELPIEISSTFCGAHAIPRGSTAKQAADNIINEQIPTLVKAIKAGELDVENIDVFCEKGVFEVEETRVILQAGKDAGLAINFHGDELHPIKGAELGAELGARAISHLEEISEEGIKAMSKSSVIGVLLPTTAYILRLKPPPARAMIDAGVAIALGTDFNPNAYCLSMPLTMHLACCILRMSMTEALAGATINAAASLGRADTHGSLEVGKFADMVVINAERWEHLIYQIGGHDDIIQHVVKHGKVVFSKR
ncbi:probable imidazolonepropionase isoform X1 [Nematostella vectensis]|uniref:probable imidazolonepropionase isoform X1 n=1 Tax=Nematostella vectensis TaxID=45351 RepID=UPI00207711A7|nr:probable imidazolonepropionase isoform X1 [Nematostella vectensis]XP_032241556.2 probable imidazolonepropionase isoform X1 [Nematostella vectensis]